MKRSVIVLLHIGYWFLYIFLIISFIWIIPNGYKKHSLGGLGRIFFLSPIGINIVLPAVIGFYTLYSILFSRFLKRKKIIALFLSAMLVSFLCALASVLIGSALFAIKNDFSDKITEIVFLSVLVFIHGIIGLIMRGFISWYADIKLKEDLTKKNYETELALVKSQLDPHFLFNTINNIDVLIQKDADKASVYLNKLSDIMRFMLYETKTEKIPLTKELAYIEKYIDLQRIRSSNPGYINYTSEGKAENLLIAPMLFIPFIENAFKYAENKQIKNAIGIKVIITREQLIFTCENNYQESRLPDPGGGLGNELIQKRLMLLYPGRHKLEITNKNQIYKATLLLNFHEN